MSTQSPVFIVGAMGSGTTLVRLILDSHTNLALAQETGFARALLANEWIPFWNQGGEWYGRLGWSRAELEAQMQQWYGELFSRFAQQRGATRWGDKTPMHTWHIPLLARVFPAASFVATVRHPGAVAASLQKRFGYARSSTVRHWVTWNTELVYQGSRLGERFTVLRYEDLVSDPEPVLRELVARLGEPWQDQLLSFHEVHQRRGTARTVEGQTRSDQPIDASRAARWTDELDRESRRKLQRSQPLAELLGYDLASPQPFRPLAPGDRRLASGDDLAALVAATSGIDWKRRARPRLENRRLKREHLQRLRRRARGRPVGGSRKDAAVTLLRRPARWSALAHSVRRRLTG